jgi:chromosome segregation ATPase
MFDDMLIGDALAKEDAKIGELEASLEDKNQHIQRLKGEVADIETTIAQKDERVRELEVSIEDRNQHILHREGEVTEITNAIAQRSDKIREIEMENVRIDGELNSIKSSATWRTVTKSMI